MKAEGVLIIPARYLDGATMLKCRSKQILWNNAMRLMANRRNIPPSINWSDLAVSCATINTGQRARLIATSFIVFDTCDDVALVNIYPISPQNHLPASRIAPREFFLKGMPNRQYHHSSRFEQLVLRERSSVGRQRR
jgi:hypothetical protein